MDTTYQGNIAPSPSWALAKSLLQQAVNVMYGTQRRAQITMLLTCAMLIAGIGLMQLDTSAMCAAR